MSEENSWLDMVAGSPCAAETINLGLNGVAIGILIAIYALLKHYRGGGS